MPEESRGGTAIYNVYSERIDGGRAAVDARNNMPNLSQLPSAGQRQLLTTEREVSTIPKGGTEATWVYPSPQMFYNGAAAVGVWCRWPTGRRRPSGPALLPGAPAPLSSPTRSLPRRCRE